MAREEREENMRSFGKMLAVMALALVFAGAAAADTLELKDGRVLQGRFLGGTQAIVRFQVDGNLQTFSVNDIVALTFTNSYGATSAPAPAPAPAAAPPQPEPAPVAQAQPVAP